MPTTTEIRCPDCFRQVEPEHLGTTHPFAVECSVFGEDCNTHGWHRNALTFVSREDAAAYGTDLFSRWMGLKEWRVTEVAIGD